MIRRRQGQLSIDDLLAFGPHRSARELLSPQLRGVDEALDDPDLVDEVFAILAQRHPESRGRGRPGTPAEVVVRMLVLKHLKDWSYAELEWEVRGSLAYRYFCRIGMEKVPDEKTFVRLGQLFEGESLARVFDRVVSIAKRKKVSRGRRMRVDSTVVEAPIRPPTDSRLCEDVVRVTRRSVRKLEEAGVTLPFVRARVRTALSRRVREIGQAKRLAKKNPEALKRPYRGLLAITRRALRQATTAIESATAQVARRRGRKRRAILREMAKLRHFIELGAAVVKQTRARVLGGQTRSEGKLISIFEPTAQILRRGKPHQPTEFGMLVKVQEAEGGLITDIGVVAGKHDASTLVPSIQRHIDIFGRPPHLVATDRGYYSGSGIAEAERLGVRRIAVPKPGHKTPARTRLERQRWFQRARSWRTGGEARISRLKNTFGSRRARYRGSRGIERTAYWAAIANNMAAIAAA